MLMIGVIFYAIERRNFLYSISNILRYVKQTLRT